MQLKSTLLLAFTFAAIGVSAAPSPGWKNGGKYYKGGSKTTTTTTTNNVNQCGVNQDQYCCNVIKAGSDKHKRWTEKYDHLRGSQGGDYLSCKSSGAGSTCSQNASPFCCNASGSKLSVGSCSPISIDLGNLNLGGTLGGVL